MAWEQVKKAKKDSTQERKLNNKVILYSSLYDGHIYKYGAVYNDVQGAVEGSVVVSNDSYMFVEQLYLAPLNKYYILRSFVFFDIPLSLENYKIIKAVLSLYVSTDASEVDFDIVIMSGMPTYPHEPLVVGDYNIANYSGNYGSKNSSKAIESEYFDIEINEAGKNLVEENIGKKLKLALISSRDISKTPPTAGNLEEIEFLTCHYTYKPKLTIYVDWNKTEKAKSEWTKVIK